ncbi:DUF5711 family protein [Christensenellaceae bacterium OttesenSCG-928-K19]|nr:DUF5711 family protein [Christensenellaceae bacterium OttesenSCG-928-K19]
MRTIFIIIAAAAAAGVVALLFLLGVIPVFSMSGNISSMDKYMPDAIFANKNGILYNESDTLYLLDKDGVEQWQLTLEMTESKTVTSPALICNYSGKTMQVMNYSKEQMFTTSIDSEIMDAAIGVEALAVLTQGVAEETGATQHLVSIFNTNGEQTGQVSMGSTRQVIDFDFYGDTDMFWVLSLDTANVLPVSYINVYKTDGSMTFNIMINTQIVESVYVTDSTIFASGTNSISSYTYFGEKQAEQQVYGWRPAAQSVTTGSFRLAYVPRSGVQEVEAVRLCTADLTDIHIRVPQGVFSVAVTQDRLYAFSADNVYVYLQDGKLERTIATDSQIVKVKQLSDNYAVLWDQQKSYIMALQ